MSERLTLKPCPKCGQDAGVIEAFDNLKGMPFFGVECAKCGYRTKANYAENLAIKEWNGEKGVEK